MANYIDAGGNMVDPRQEDNYRQAGTVPVKGIDPRGEDNYRQAGIDPSSFLPRGVSLRGVWNPGETPEVGPFGGGGGGGFRFGGSDPRLNTMDRIDRERYEGETEARSYYLNAQKTGTVWDTPMTMGEYTANLTPSQISGARNHTDIQGSLSNYYSPKVTAPKSSWNIGNTITNWGGR
jgi:hypothetical protein